MNGFIYKVQIILLFLVVFFIIPSTGQATTYYVDATNGNNFYPGTTETAAFKTIQKAANVMVYGDTCIVLPGIYNERVKINKTGSSNAPMIFKAEGAAVNHGFTIRADNIKVIGFEITDTVNEWDNGAGIHLEGKYGEIENNYIHHVTRVGIQIFADPPNSSSTSHNTIKNNRIEYAGLAGIEVYGTNNTVENNDISHTLQYPPKWINPPIWADADGMHFYGESHIICKNYIHDIRLSDRYNVNPHIDAFQTQGPAYNIFFEKNIIDIPYEGISGSLHAVMIDNSAGPVSNLIFRNNIFKNRSAFNIWGTNRSVSYIAIVNNTFINQLNYAIEFHNCEFARVKNNIFYNVGNHTRPYLVYDTVTGLDVGYNCHYMSDGNPPKGSPWPNDLWQVNPQFVSVETANFRLKSTSPLIDAGANLTEVTADLDGILRPQGSGYDLGAYEYVVISSICPI